MRAWFANLMEQLKMRYLENWLAIDGQKCFSYGGQERSSQLPGVLCKEVRVCTKNRWHTDSHAYEFVRFPYEYPRED